MVIPWRGNVKAVLTVDLVTARPFSTQSEGQLRPCTTDFLGEAKALSCLVLGGVLHEVSAHVLQSAASARSPERGKCTGSDNAKQWQGGAQTSSSLGPPQPAGPSPAATPLRRMQEEESKK